MKYIIMAGGKYEQWITPKQLLKVNNEVIIERTIRLLKENGINDIAISTDNPAFEYLNVPILKHNNSYEYKNKKLHGYWVDAFYPTNEPVCYIFGDVYFSEEAIKTIIKTETDDIEMFGSMPPFAYNYPKFWIEPFALKVVNTEHLKASIQKTKELAKEGRFWREIPIMWELWTVIKDVPLQTKANEYIYNYIAINDYTSDIDNIDDIKKIEHCLNLKEGGKMIKVVVSEEFTLKRFNELKNIVRAREDKNEIGRLYPKDTFECSQDLADYLSGNNAYKTSYIKVIEVIPEEVKKEPITVVETEEAKDIAINFYTGEEVKEVKPKRKRKK